MGFHRQENSSGLPLPTQWDPSNSGIELHLMCLLQWRADLLPPSHLGNPLAVTVANFQLHFFREWSENQGILAESLLSV